jgi:hypothetical protein
LEEFIPQAGWYRALCVPAFFAGALFVLLLKLMKTLLGIIFTSVKTKTAVKTRRKCHHDADEDHNSSENSLKVSS